jgi:hypothetical protein
MIALRIAKDTVGVTFVFCDLWQRQRTKCPSGGKSAPGFLTIQPYFARKQKLKVSTTKLIHVCTDSFGTQFKPWIRHISLIAFNF